MSFKPSLLCLLISILFFCSCKKDISSPINNNPPQSFNEGFEQFWNEMNVNYVYWDIDTTNWDNVYKKYKPLFAGLNINNQTDEQLAASYFREMIAGLVDSHYVITFAFPGFNGVTFSPALNRKLNNKDYHNPYNYMRIDTNYLNKGFIKGSYATSNQVNMLTVCGKINNNILYFSCSNFSLLEAYNAPGNNSVKTSLQYLFTQLADRGIKELIIDVRNNPGGDVEDLNFLIGHFIKSPLPLGYSRYKSANGRLAYTPWISANITPYTGGVNLTIPVVALADNFTISLAEEATMAIHSLPAGIFIGEKTWGATGPVTLNEIYNSGPFTVPGFLSVTESSAEFKYIDGKQYEGIGFPPDIAIPFNLSTLNLQHDAALEKAISLAH